MHGVAAGLSAKQMEAVATYYAGLKTATVAPPSKPAPKRAAAGREIVVNGMWQKNMPSCDACHGLGARGIGTTFPPLAGQPASYIEGQLQAWQQGKRPAGPAALMPSVAKSLSPAEVQDVAAYLATLPATGAVPKTAYPDLAPAMADAMPGYFQPSLAKDAPKGKFGASVRRGYDIFMDTPKYAKAYVGNGLSCQDCHTNRGRQANAAPMWAAWVLYPKYRGKNRTVNTMAMRNEGCFRYSENAQGSPSGKPPTDSSSVIRDLSSYMFWMAKNAPTGQHMKGQGYPKIAKPASAFARVQGARLYKENCAACHGASGQGLRLANGDYAFPPLWGAKSFNWGAGMHRIDKAASFILHNMPLGRPDSLSLQEAWDVAAFMDSHPRPQDPRFNGDLKQTIATYHAHRDIDDYGKTIGGYHLGAPGTLPRWEKAQGG